MTLVEQYLQSSGLVIEDVIGNVVENISSEFFTDSHVEFWEVVVPAKTLEFDTAYIEFPNNVFIRSFQNLLQTRCDDVLVKVEGIIIPTKKLVKTVQEELIDYPVVNHGKGLLFDRKDVVQTLTIKTVCVDISIEGLNYGVLTLLKSLYYHLFTGNFDAVFRDLQRLSEEKKNIVSANTKNRKIRTNPVKVQSKGYVF